MQVSSGYWEIWDKDQHIGNAHTRDEANQALLKGYQIYWRD